MTLSMDEYAHRLAQWRHNTRATWALLAGGGETYLLERALTPMASPKHYARWLVRMAQSGDGADYQITAEWLLTEYEGQLRTMFNATRPAAEALGIESPSVAAEKFPYRQMPADSGPARFIGSNPERQSVGDPGHCEACVSVGHVIAHPDLGCGDVGCNVAHKESPSVSAVGVPAPSAPGTEAGEPCVTEGMGGGRASTPAPSTSWTCGVVGPNGLNGEGTLVCDRHQGHGGGHEETVGGLTYGWFDAEGTEGAGDSPLAPSTAVTKKLVQVQDHIFPNNTLFVEVPTKPAASTDKPVWVGKPVWVQRDGTWVWEGEAS